MVDLKRKTKNINNIKTMEKRLGGTPLFRIKSNKMIGGVAAGLAEYFNLDVTLVRVLMVVAFFTPIPVIIPYIILWIVMPTKESAQITSVNFTPVN
jgi:phage shock protein PspC (stress-responsive transcriptional regulator)